MSEPVDILTLCKSIYPQPMTAACAVRRQPMSRLIRRYIANRSSGRQGSAIAQALVNQGAEVVFISGPAKPAPWRADRTR